MKLKTSLQVIILAGIIVNSIFLFKLSGKKNKIAFVKSSVMLDEYDGMKEAKKVYKLKVDKWAQQIDSLEQIYNSEKEKLQYLTNIQRNAEERRLASLYNKFMQIKSSIETKAKQEDEEMTNSVLKQVNSYIEKYSEENGYDIVIGTTATGNLLYGTDEIDITEDLIRGLNVNYKGK